MKKLIKTSAFILATLIFCSFTPPKNGKVVLMISLEVKNFSEWKTGFDAGAPVREKAGIKVISVCSALDNENQITVIEEAANLQTANDFVAVLKSKVKEGDFKNFKITIYDKAE
ncbi:MAG: hypothetical protein V4622_04065 [Bacteroidota bacterium]